jgi:uncharacterized 2Fe-2S/4Fe-4S cluster protein (DUF4445 family)
MSVAMKDRYKVRFLPIDRIIKASREESILDVAMRAGVYINGSCGGNGTCGRCKITIASGEVFSSRDTSISSEEYEAGFRLACASYPLGDVTVVIPLESQIDRSALRRSPVGEHVLTPGRIDGLTKGWSVDPPTVKRHVKLAPPSQEHNVSDAARLMVELKTLTKIEPSLDFDALEGLSRKLRDSDWDVTATLRRELNTWTITNVEEGDTENRNYAIAVDIGTTTVCAELLDMGVHASRPTRRKGRTEGRIKGESSDYNGQISYGEDVISRIMYARKAGGLHRLRTAVTDTVNLLIEEMVKQAAIDINDITQVVLAGNTTMTHLILGLNPQYLMLDPYVPLATEIPHTQAERVGLRAHRKASVRFFPSVASYVGGDIVAGVLGSGMFQREEIALFIDIGTNGEIVVGNREWLTCASCSAGPAFEGGGITSGIRAVKGAIEQVRINPSTFEPMLLTIGRGKPVGICGSGLIDLMAELFEVGLIEQNGKFKRDSISRRVRERQDVWEYVICYADDSAIGKDIVLTEADIDNLMRAKAAIYAGCRVLLDNVGLDIHDIERVIIAGGFGHHLCLEKAKMIGLLPDIPDDKFLFLGNGSLLGARLACMSHKLEREAKAIAEGMTNIELSNSRSFMDEFVAALFIPHTDEQAFPHVIERLRQCKRGGDS